jgi:hypothetical protein
MLYFFDVHAGPKHFFDEEGTECPGLEMAAHIAAETAARLEPNPLRAEMHLPVVVDVRTESGRQVLVVTLPPGTA